MTVQFSQPDMAADAEALGTDPIPARYYYDEDWYELERKAIFMRSWLNIGHVCELPEAGSFFTREIEFAKASIIVARGKDGEIRAFHNACTHRGTQLTDEACGRRSTFSCPYHMWTFGMDGALLSAPDFERFHVDKKDCALSGISLGIRAGLIFISFEPQMDLDSYLGPMGEMLDALPVARATDFHEYVYDIDANWKLTYDNFQENYHLRFVHKRTVGPGVGPDNPFGYPVSVGLHGLHRTQTIWVNPEPELKPSQMLVMGKLMPRLMQDGLAASEHARDYLALFPNLFLLGSPGNHFLHYVMPISAEKSRGVIRLYWVGDDETAGVRFAREAMMATTRDVHSEDVAVIEAGQRGLSSGALKHIHFQEQEILCRHLIRACEAQVAAYQRELSDVA